MEQPQKTSRQEELTYLNETLLFIESQKEKEIDHLSTYKQKLISSRKDMWENTPSASSDFSVIAEMNLYLDDVNQKTDDYVNSVKRIRRLEQLYDSPYFGRIDFQEEGYSDVEPIYIGLSTLMDKSSRNILVYDWRSPISSMFYQFEIGKGSYQAPYSIIEGDISLKRQYKIEHSALKYFFDSNLCITDEVLQEVLKSNTSMKMRTIVETIQREQDLIIRDTKSNLVIVQGVAGSGKTSIALHRIAYLLYIGADKKLTSHQIMILSPNNVFGNYISHVLPELGEENVAQQTFEEIGKELLGSRYHYYGRQKQLERLINCSPHKQQMYLNEINFKNSYDFMSLLDRFIQYYERKLIKFHDITYLGKTIETKEILKNFFLNNKIQMPIAKRLKRIETIIQNKIQPLEKQHLEKIEKTLIRIRNHNIQIQASSRHLLAKRTRPHHDQLRKLIKIDIIKMYLLLFQTEGLIELLSPDLANTVNLTQIRKNTLKNLMYGRIPYEDLAPLIYLKLRVEGIEPYADIKHLLIDEAQDYYPLQYQVMKLLFPKSSYTVLGDFNQTIERTGSASLYEDVKTALHTKQTVSLALTKSYRSSVEINALTRHILKHTGDFESFDRHGELPIIYTSPSKKELCHQMAKDINKLYQEGYKTIAILCKGEKELFPLKTNLTPYIQVSLMENSEEEAPNHPLLLTAYMAKGLEFDAVLIYNVSQDNYNTDFDRRLLYIACTRALHKIHLYSLGGVTNIIKDFAMHNNYPTLSV